MKSRLLACLVVSLSMIVCVQGCQPQMCRRKRDVPRVRYSDLPGCSGVKPPTWTRQIAYCLDQMEGFLIIKGKPWYEETYSYCSANGCKNHIDISKNHSIGRVYKVAYINECVQCWRDKIAEDKIYDTILETSKTKIEKCVDDYASAFLEDSEAVLEPLSRHKYEIGLPETRPANYWWSVTVDLPCKPKNFFFFNAYCINSIIGTISEGDYKLVQNKLVKTDAGMTFFVEFSDDCKFESKDIRIIWDESTPSPGYPQVGSLGSSNRRQQVGMLEIYYDAKDAERLRHVDSPPTEMSRTETEMPRRKRNVYGGSGQGLNMLGLEFPCEIESLQIPDTVPRRDRSYHIEDFYGKRYLIDTDFPTNTRHLSENTVTSKLLFEINYGTGDCSFDAGDVITTPDPAFDWIHKERIACMTCRNAGSSRLCATQGTRTMCLKNEVCQTEVRQITKRRKLITKSCKQKKACEMNSESKMKNKECRRRQPGSVCLCCCDTNMCNSGVSECPR